MRISRIIGSFGLGLWLTATAGLAQAPDCGSDQKLLREYGRCVQISEDPILALGNLQPKGERTIAESFVLHDVDRGDIPLMLSPGLVQFAQESVAESFEVEGYFSLEAGREVLLVTSLRPIE